MKKRGVSPLIAWVLLVGFAVALGSMITIWYTQEAKTVTQETLGTFETGIECAEANYNMMFLDPVDQPCQNIKVVNTGMQKITKLLIATDTAEEIEVVPPEGLLAREEYEVNLESPFNTVSITPIIQPGENSLICPKDQEYQCKGLPVDVGEEAMGFYLIPVEQYTGYLLCYISDPDRCDDKWRGRTVTANYPRSWEIPNGREIVAFPPPGTISISNDCTTMRISNVGGSQPMRVNGQSVQPGEQEERVINEVGTIPGVRYTIRFSLWWVERGENVGNPDFRHYCTAE